MQDSLGTALLVFLILCVVMLASSVFIAFVQARYAEARREVNRAKAAR